MSDEPRLVKEIEVELRVGLLLSFWEERSSPSGITRVSARVPAPVIPGLKRQEEGNAAIYSGEKLPDRVPYFLDAALGIGRFTCCHWMAGLEVWADKTSWTGGTMDHFWHLQGWFEAAKALYVRGEESTSTFVWDESCLTFQKSQARWILSDARTAKFSKGIEWKPISVDPDDFALALVREGQRLETFCQEVLQEIERRGFSVEALLQRIHLLGDKPEATPQDPALLYAVIARECYLPDLWASIAALRATVEARWGV